MEQEVDQAAETKRALDRLTQPQPRAARGKGGDGMEKSGAGTDEIGKKVEELLQNSTDKPGSER